MFGPEKKLKWAFNCHVPMTIVARKHLLSLLHQNPLDHDNDQCRLGSWPIGDLKLHARFDIFP